MRYKPIILLCFALLLTLTRAAALPTFSGGAGSESDPFRIGNRTDLEQLSQCLGANNKGLHFRLVDDIDLGGALWIPIGGNDDYDNEESGFMGKIHGDGHAIKNMRIDGHSASNPALGLFGRLREGAYLRDIHVVDGYVQLAPDAPINYIGLLVGEVAIWEIAQADSIVVRNCSATGVIDAPLVRPVGLPALTGGLLGNVYATATNNASATITIAQCSYSGTVVGSAYLGGLAGNVDCNMPSTAINISECYSVADIRYVGDGTLVTPVGGLVGIASPVSTITISRCYAAGSIAPCASNPSAQVGGLVGIVGKPETPEYNGTVTIAQSVAAQTVIRYGGDNVSRISKVRELSANRVLADNFGYADMLLNDEALADTSAADLPQGESKTLAELSTQATYSSAPLSWNFATPWAIRGDQKNFPYFAQQSAPAFINDVLYRELTASIAHAADSVVATKGLARQRVGALLKVGAGNIAVELNGVNSGDTIFVTVYESGKLPSYCTWSVAHEAKGAGTAEDPYQIWTRSDLVRLGLPSHIGKIDSAIHYRIMADIDLGGEDWVPIGTSNDNGSDLTLAFRGKLHGGGHRLNNIRISTSTLAYVGLFGVLANDAYVDSLYLVGGSITCSTPGLGKNVCVGAVAGFVCGSSIENSETIAIRGCSNSATVVSSDKYCYTGGLLGFTSGDVNVVVASCSNFGNVTGGGYYTGGLIGRAEILAPATLSLTSSYNHATVRSTQPDGTCELGGIVGRANANASVIDIIDCYAAGRVLTDTSTQVSFVGGIVGHTAGTVNIRNSLAAQDWIGSVSLPPAGNFQRLVGDVGAGAGDITTVVNGLALDSLKINGNATSGTASDFQGQNKSLPDLKKKETYSGWDFADTWAIREPKTLPYLGWQSATPVVDRLFFNSATNHVGEVNILNRADSIGVYKGSTMVRVIAIRPAPAGNNGFTPPAASLINIDDTLFFVSYESGKSPSMVVQAVIKAPPAPLKGSYTIGFATTDSTNFATFEDAQEAITYGGLASDVSFRIAEGEYQQVADPFLEFPANVAARPYRVVIEGEGSVTLRYAEGADVDARHIAIADTLHTTIRNLRLQGPNSAATQPYATWRTGGGVEYSVPDALDTLRLHNVSIDGCRADSIGGAVAMSAKAGSLLLMDGCNIAHCYADVNGGAVYAAPQANIYLSAIADCGVGRGKGGGVYATSSAMLYGSIAVGNTSCDTAPESDNAYVLLGGTSNLNNADAYNVAGDSTLYADIFTSATPNANDNNGVLMTKLGGLADNIIPATSLNTWEAHHASLAGLLHRDVRDTIRPRNTGFPSASSQWADAGTVEQLTPCMIVDKPTITAPVLIVCDSAVLFASRTDSRTAVYTWRRDGLEVGRTTDTIFSAGTTGRYTVSVADHVCEKTSDTHVDIVVLPHPGTPNIRPVSGVCEDETLTFATDTNSYQHYEWTRPDIDTVALTASSVSHTAVGEYTYKLRVKNDADVCWSAYSSPASAAIVVKPKTPAITTADVCYGSPITFATVDTADKYAWTLHIGGGMTIMDTTNNGMLSRDDEGDFTYTLRTQKNGCWSDPSASANGIVHGIPLTPTIEPVGNVMIGDTLKFTTTATATRFEWTQPNIDTVTTVDRTVVQTEQGMYTYKLRVQNSVSGATIACWSDYSEPRTASITEMILESDTSTAVNSITVLDDENYSIATLEDTIYVLSGDNPTKATVVVVPRFSGQRVSYNGVADTVFDVDMQRAGLRVVAFTVTSANGLRSRTYYLAIEKKLAFLNYAIVKWGSLILLHKNRLIEEGYTVEGCTWYKNNVAMSTELSYAEGSNRTVKLQPGASYRYEVKTPEGLLRSTNRIVAAQASSTLQAYPNPIVSGTPIALDLGEEGDAEVEIYSVATGAMVKKIPVNGRTVELRVALPVGVYLIKARGQQVKIVVQ